MGCSTTWVFYLALLICKMLTSCRAEYWFREVPPNNGGEAAHACDPELESYMHLAALNRGVLLTPFHNSTICCHSFYLMFL